MMYVQPKETAKTTVFTDQSRKGVIIQMKETEDFRSADSARPVFENEAVFRRKLKSYVKHCHDEKCIRLPNAAGFCRFSGIRRQDFKALALSYPLLYDVAQSTFIDEAFNMKMPNSAAYMSFISQFNEHLGENCEEDENGTVRVILEQDPETDGI